MAIVPTLVHGADAPHAGSATDATSYVTASWSPIADDLCLAFVLGHRTGGPGLPTLTGNGITWTLITGADVAFHGIASQTGRLFCFRGAAASPSAGAITIDWGANTLANCWWQFQQWAGVNEAAGAQGVVQAVTNRADSGATTLGAVLASFADSVNNATVALVAQLGTGGGVTIEAGYSSLTFTGIAGQGGTQGEYLIGEDLSPSFTGMASGNSKAIIALELAAEGAAPSNPAGRRVNRTPLTSRVGGGLVS